MSSLHYENIYNSYSDDDNYTAEDAFFELNNQIETDIPIPIDLPIKDVGENYDRDQEFWNFKEKYPRIFHSLPGLDPIHQDWYELHNHGEIRISASKKRKAQTAFFCPEFTGEIRQKDIAENILDEYFLKQGNYGPSKFSRKEFKELFCSPGESASYFENSDKFKEILGQIRNKDKTKKDKAVNEFDFKGI